MFIEFDDGTSVYTYDLSFKNSKFTVYSFFIGRLCGADHHFQLIKTNNSATTVNPSAYIHTGQVKHTGSHPTTIPPIPSVSNNVTSGQVSRSSFPSWNGGTVTYTVAITNPNEDDLINGYEGDITLDYIHIHYQRAQVMLPIHHILVHLEVKYPLAILNIRSNNNVGTKPLLFLEAVSVIIPTTYNLPRMM
ncbi:MAG: hypothetical protein R3A45_03055 [Bdellovibrionota bacterium]